MKPLIFTCPTTGENVDIGIESEIRTLLRIRSEIVRAVCPACGKQHEWRINDAQLPAQPVDLASAGIAKSSR